MKRVGVLLLAGIILITASGCKIQYSEEVTSEGETSVKENINAVIDVRYTNEKFKTYFEYCEKAFEKSNPDVDIRLVYAKEDSQYLQNIIEGSYSEETTVDVYMASDSSLGMAYLAGIAAKNPYDVFSEENYCRTAINACSYGENLIAYPLSYDTSFFVYREGFLTAEDMRTFENLKLFGENADYSSEELMTIESIFRCDLNDIFINYGFIGAGIDLGGDSGSDPAVIDILTGKTTKSVYDYISIIDYFSINTEEKYDDIINKFIEGKYLSTIASTYDLDTILESDAECEMGAFPDYNELDTSSPLSITQCLVVNPNSDYVSIASDFARFTTYETASILYEMTGTLSSRRNIKYENAELEKIYDSYEKSDCKNKLQYGEQVYPLIEIALHNIIAGNDSEEEFTKVEDYMKNQLK